MEKSPLIPKCLCSSLLPCRKVPVFHLMQGSLRDCCQAHSVGKYHFGSSRERHHIESTPYYTPTQHDSPLHVHFQYHTHQQHLLRRNGPRSTSSAPRQWSIRHRLQRWSAGLDAWARLQHAQPCFVPRYLTAEIIRPQGIRAQPDAAAGWRRCGPQYVQGTVASDWRQRGYGLFSPALNRCYAEDAYSNF